MVYPVETIVKINVLDVCTLAHSQQFKSHAVAWWSMPLKFIYAYIQCKHFEGRLKCNIIKHTIAWKSCLTIVHLTQTHCTLLFFYIHAIYDTPTHTFSIHRYNSQKVLQLFLIYLIWFGYVRCFLSDKHSVLVICIFYD